MRFEKAEQLLQLAFDMQSSAEGLSLRDIADRFAVSIRT
ncbi:MAG: WYL domain-containing protein, partial [Alphaproteobacteria bacterium]|nr:WYL domain-containing protein [Alphaproteobacteria bacterium]